MKYKFHLANQHQKLYHISKAQPTTFSYGHPNCYRLQCFSKRPKLTFQFSSRCASRSNKKLMDSSQNWQLNTERHPNHGGLKNFKRSKSSTLQKWFCPKVKYPIKNIFSRPSKNLLGNWNGSTKNWTKSLIWIFAPKTKFRFEIIVDVN